MKKLRLFSLVTLILFLLAGTIVPASADGDAPTKQPATKNQNGEITFGNGISSEQTPKSEIDASASMSESWQIEYSQTWESDSLVSAAGWSVSDNNSSGYCWDDVSVSNGGLSPDDASYSLWPAAGCANGDVPNNFFNNYYPNVAINTGATYGPFSLADYTDAKLEFDYNSMTEVGYDFFCYFVSADNITYEGECISGGSGAWYHTILPLTKFKGDSSVWVQFFFSSDDSNGDYGPYVDNIRIFGKQFVTVNSNAALDGWILESKESSNKGGTINATEKYLRIGDAKGDKQYVSILSFNTKDIPDTATITSVDIRIKQYTPIGVITPAFGNRLLDIKMPKFGSSPGLQLSDFQAAPSYIVSNGYNAISEGGNWVSFSLKSDSFDYINKAGTTQFKFKFAVDDNDDNGNDFERWFSGNSPFPPTITVHYIP